MATPPPGLGPRRRSPRAQRGDWPSPASGRSALGSPRAAAPSSTRRPGAGRRSAHPIPHTPAAGGATPGPRPTPAPAPAPAATSVPTSAHPGTPARLSPASWGVSPLPPPLRGPPLPLSSAPRPPPRRPPKPRTRNPRQGLRRACAGLFPRTCENTRGRGGRLPRTCASARGFPSIFPRGQARPDECPLRPWPALAAAGPALTASVEAAPGAPPLRAARRGGDAGTWAGGRPQPPAGRAGSGLERAGAAPSPGQPAPRPPLA